MSLILEALRKSEAERRRGQVPGLHAELPPAAQPARARRTLWPWLLTPGLVAVAAAAWWLGGERLASPAGGEPPASPQQRATPADENSVVETVRDPTARRHGAVASAASGAPPPPSPGDSAPPTTERQNLAAPRVGAAPVVPPAPPSVAVATGDAALAGQQPSPAVASGGSRGDTTGARAPTSAASQSPADAGSPLPAGAAPSTRDATVDAPTDTRAPLHLADLGADERRALPPLRVSMHMWAPTSARRFAIIDGARVNEGDRLGEAVVEEISRDGVVLAWRGRRVHIPIH